MTIQSIADSLKVTNFICKIENWAVLFQELPEIGVFMSRDQLCQTGRHRAGSSNPHSFLDAYKSKDLAILAVLILLTLLAVSCDLGRAHEVVSMSLIQFNSAYNLKL